ncbi:MAG: DUF917 domain-containing protein, partial [Pseudomonadota bacterium]
LGQRLVAAVPCELGGSNTAVPFFVAAMTGGFAIDADPAGRAVPEITHSGYYLAGLPASPIVAANAFGEVFVLDHIADDRRAEALMRALCHKSRNDIAVVDHALPAATLQKGVIPGTLRRAQKLGRLWRDLRKNPREALLSIADAAQGRIAFRGRVVDSRARTEAGFTVGDFFIAGSDAFIGQTYRVSLKNENMAAWRDGKIDSSIPEIISVFDTKTCEVVTNPHVSIGRDIAIMILPAPEIFTTPEGLAVFGPSYAGI